MLYATYSLASVRGRGRGCSHFGEPLTYYYHTAQTKGRVGVLTLGVHGAEASAISLWHSPRYTILILVICAIWYLSVPSSGSCDPAEC